LDPVAASGSVTISHAAQWQEGRLLFEPTGTCHAILKAAGIKEKD
jgi:hypothetical protein